MRPLVVTLVLSLAASLLAPMPAEAKKPAREAAGPATGDSQQKLDFEDELIEGMNKKPYDSLSQISERDKKKNDGHLYWKRSNFQPESNEALRELRFVQ